MIFPPKYIYSNSIAVNLVVCSSSRLLTFLNKAVNLEFIEVTLSVCELFKLTKFVSIVAISVFRVENVSAFEVFVVYNSEFIFET